LASDGLYNWLQWLQRLAESQTGSIRSGAADEAGRPAEPLPAGDPGPKRRLQPRLDLDEFEVVYARHFDHLFRYFQGLTQDAETAQDLTQDVFKYALQHANRFPFRSQTERAWLFHIARRRVLPRYWRSRRWRSEQEFLRRLDTDCESADVAGHLVRDELRAQVRRLIEGFDDERRDVFLLIVYLEYTVAETAETLGMKEGTVRSHLRRGRLLLAERLRGEPALSAAEGQALDDLARGGTGRIVEVDFSPGGTAATEVTDGAAADGGRAEAGPDDEDRDDDTPA
jgi:RNA polymerase sigma factor (sigma-70 family)